MAIAERVEARPVPEVIGVPSHEKRMGLITEGSFQTALHEGHHVLCIVGENLTLGGVNMNKRGNTLASTHAIGASMAQMRVVAAGGGVETADGHGPSGHGSDMQKVDYLPGSNTHVSVFEAARSHIKRFSKDVRLHFGSLLAWHGGNITGQTVMRFLRIAEMEVAGIAGQQTIEKRQEVKEADQAQPEGTATIETLVNGDQIIILGGERITICSQCFGQEEHRPDCPAKGQEPKNGKKEEQETVQKPKPMTRRDILLYPKQPIPIVVFLGPATASTPLKKAA